MEAQVQALQDDLAQQQAESQALLQQLQQQQALIQQLLQAQQQAQAPVVPPQAPAVPFALTPAQAIMDIIDLTETAGIKLHKAVTAPLATPFDGSPQKLASFLEDVKQHATDCGWMAADGLLIINNQDPVNPHDYNLITHHCMLSLENVRAIDCKQKLYSHSFITRLVWSYDMTPTPHPVQRCSTGKYGVQK